MAGFATAAGLVAASTLLYVSPAAAAPGDANASGLSIDLGLDVLGLLEVDAVADVGAVSGNDAETLADVDVAGLLGADATAGVIDLASASDLTGASASSEVADIDVNLLGLDLLSVGAASAFASCPVGAAPTADAELAGLTVLGQAVTVDADTPTVLTDIGLDLGPLATVTADIVLEQVEATTATSAISSALQLSIAIEGTVAGIPLLSTDAGTITLAQADCERPLVAVAAATVTPGDGPTVGGQTVTIAGTGFTPDTTVAFGGVPAEVVAIDPTGTAITVVTPPGVAGPTTIDIANGAGAAVGSYVYVESAIAGIAPLQGSSDGGTSVTLTGQNLEDAATVTFGGVPGTITSVTPGAVVVTTPANPAGPADIVLSLTGGGDIVSPTDYLYVDTALTAFTPTAGSELGGTVVRIDGTGLQTAESVDFGGVTVPVTEIGPDGAYVVATAPAGVGEVAVSVNLAGGPALVAPAPYLYLALDDRDADELLPAAGSTLGGTTVTIEGEGLQDITTVDFGGVPATITAVEADGTAVTVLTPAHDAAAVPVTLTFSGGESIVADEYFDYVVTAITDMVPNAGSELGGTLVQITGEGLDAATAVLFGGVSGTDLTVAPDGESITVFTPAGTGIVPVVVAVDGGPSLTSATPFTYLAIEDRGIDGLAPAQGSTLGGTIVTIDGEGLNDPTDVVFGDVPGVIVAVADDGSSIQVEAPAAAAGAVDVTVTFSGGETLTADDQFVYVDTEVFDLAPVAGSSLGGTTVVIDGEGLATAESVEFDGVAGTLVDVAEDGSSVTVVTPAGLGIADVEVILAGGTVLTSPVDFEYLTAADRVIDGFTPGVGPAAGGSTVVITGDGFDDITAVDFGGALGTIVAMNEEATEIVVTSPAHPAGAVSLALLNASGERFEAAAPYVFVDMAIAGMTPAAGSEIGGTTVTIGGSGFGTATTVEFGGVPAVIEDIADDGSSIVVTTPAGTGSVPVVVGFEGGTTVTAPAPYEYIAFEDRAITGMEPTSGSINGGTAVTITGEYLHDTTEVFFDGVAGEILDVAADGTSVVVMTPVGDLGEAVVMVAFGPESLTAADPFVYLAPVAPVIGSITPNSGPMTGGTTVVITGEGLRDASEVTFGGVPATIVDSTDPVFVPGEVVPMALVDSITVITPYGQVGTVDVVVTTPDGTTTAEDAFEYTLAAVPPVTTPAGEDGTTGASFGPSGLASTGVQGGPISAIALIALLIGAGIWRRAAARTAD
ncbi:IPT/TIG domain-containing protein [Herbiconiux sp. L3-i23]|uniref:beta strand repeat-containing protein n=1 Tax=Herbiconiux sp. L3-i23 TaxID=2905871 RepID=UPI00205035D7|nr:IPT/TIG domain-containing protein [Herbiconiux sp. L3-i23]BDI23591.1 hypothetical protein L3i23_23670 [Herbiconiux sp. L3-i23]